MKPVVFFSKCVAPITERRGVTAQSKQDI